MYRWQRRYNCWKQFWKTFGGIACVDAVMTSSWVEMPFMELKFQMANNEQITWLQLQWVYRMCQHLYVFFSQLILHKHGAMRGSVVVEKKIMCCSATVQEASHQLTYVDDAECAHKFIHLFIQRWLAYAQCQRYKKISMPLPLNLFWPHHLLLGSSTISRLLIAAWVADNRENTSFYHLWCFVEEILYYFPHCQSGLLKRSSSLETGLLVMCRTSHIQILSELRSRYLLLLQRCQRSDCTFYIFVSILTVADRPALLSSSTDSAFCEPPVWVMMSSHTTVESSAWFVEQFFPI